MNDLRPSVFMMICYESIYKQNRAKQTFGGGFP